MKIRILLVDDHTIIRCSLRALLERQHDFEVAGETPDGREAVDMVEQLAPDIVLMDVALRGSDMSGIEATRKITDLQTGTRVIALSLIEALSHVKQMLAAGASGYLFKGCREDELLAAIYAVLEGRTYFSEEAARVIQEDYVAIVQHAIDAGCKLSPREFEILKQLVSGHPTKFIADELHISRKTVDTHRHRIMRKLSISSIAELTRYALREGIIMGDE